MSESYSERMRRELGAEIIKKPATREEMYLLFDQLLEKFAALDARLEAFENKGLADGGR